MKDLILLHGALGHSSNFKPYEGFLSQHFNLHTLLFHGHGSTSVPDGGLSIELYVEQLKLYIEQHDLQEVHIFGYSMGGYVALSYASQFPGKVASILTLAVKLDWTVDGVAKETKMLNADLIQEKVPKYALQLQQLHGEQHWSALLPAIAQLMVRLAEQPLLDTSRFETLSTKVQMMVGDKDAMVGIDETLAAAKSIPDAGFAVLPNTKHPIEMLRPDLLIGLMIDFWKI